MGLPHFTLDLRDGVRGGRGRAVPRRPRRRADAEPVRALQRRRAPRRDARVRRPARRGRSRDRPLRAGRPPTGCCAPPPTRRRTRATCSPRSRPARWRGCGSRSASCASREVRALAREAGLPVADKRDSQDLCFLAGTGKRAFLARHAGLRERPGAIVDARRAPARPPPRPAPLHGRPAQGARGRRRAEAAVRAGQGRGFEHGRRSARARQLATTAVARPRRRPAPPGRRGRPREAPLPLPPAALPRARAEDGGRLALALGEPVDGAAPGQVACLLRGDVVVGHGVIARRTRLTLRASRLAGR